MLISVPNHWSIGSKWPSFLAQANVILAHVRPNQMDFQPSCMESMVKRSISLFSEHGENHNSYQMPNESWSIVNNFIGRLHFMTPKTLRFMEDRLYREFGRTYVRLF